MLNKNENILLTHLRNNSRKPLLKISQETKIPVSTLFDTLKKLENDTIEKHVTLIDFKKAGFGLKVHFGLSAQRKKELLEFLLESPHVNTLSTIIDSYDYYTECIFKNMKQLNDFKTELDTFKINNLLEIFVTEDLKREAFVDKIN